MNAEIKKEKWEKFLEALSRRRFDWKSRIEVLSNEFGDQILSDGLPLNGITMETREGAVTIDISVGEDTRSHQTHSIKDPTRIAFLRADSAHGDIVDIEQKDGTKTLITLIEPMGVIVGFTEVEMIATAFSTL